MGGFGAAHLIDILCGPQTEKVARFGHRRLPAFGSGADRGKNEWRSIIRQMVATGFLRLDIAGYGRESGIAYCLSRRKTERTAPAIP